MIWSIYAMLGQNMWWVDNPKLSFEDEAWDALVAHAAEKGLNQIVLDIGEGLQYATHPELSREGAWTKERAKKEVKRCAELGIELIPKLNFSATHHTWLGEYGKMMSTSVYYRVCSELIKEVATAFCNPRYIHIGMDEEGDPQFFKKSDMVHYRQGELIWHDLQFLCDCVREAGATPWIWGDLCVYNPEEFRKRMSYDIVLQPWIYFAVRKEHWTPLASKERYSRMNEAKLGIEYMEEAPIWQDMTREGVRACNDGYMTVPCTSNCFECEISHDDVVEHFANNCKTDSLLGFMTAPWTRTTMTALPQILRSIDQLAEAREKFVK